MTCIFACRRRRWSWLALASSCRSPLRLPSRCWGERRIGIGHRPRRPSPFPPAQDKRLAHPMSSRPSCPRAVVANLGSLQVIQHGRSERSSQARHRHLHVSSSPRSKGDGRPQYRSRPVVRPSHLPTSFTSSHRHAGRRRARHPRPHKRLETPRCSTYS